MSYQGKITQDEEEFFCPLGSRCAFAAQGSGADVETTINSSPIVFNKVDLNVCNGYDVNTGKQITWTQVLASYAHHNVTTITIRLIHRRRGIRFKVM